MRKSTPIWSKRSMLHLMREVLMKLTRSLGWQNI